MDGNRSELDGLLTEMLVTGAGGGLGNDDLSVLRRHGRMYRLLGLVPTALGSAEEVTGAWKTLVELFLALRLRLVQSAEEVRLSVTLELDLSGVRTATTLSLADLWATLMPLSLWVLRQLDATATAAPLRAGAPPLEGCLVLGIAGAGGSGKTWTASVLKRLLNELCVLPGFLTGASLGGPEGAATGPVCEAASMDGYHFPNSRLSATPAPHGDAEGTGDAATMAAFKGSLDTIDAAALAADLLAVKAMEPGGLPVQLPLYDRSTHDPRPCAVEVAPIHRILILEGLYLLQGARADPPEAPGPALPAPGTAASPLDAATPCPLFDSGVRNGLWYRVWAAMDACLFLDVAQGVCRDRLEARKVAAGKDPAAVKQHYDRVDAPVFESVAAQWRRADAVLRLDGTRLSAFGVRGSTRGVPFALAPAGRRIAPRLAKPSAGASPHAAERHKPDSGASARSLAAPTAEERSPPPVALRALTVPAKDAPGAVAPAGVPTHLVFVGLSPALQRSIVLPGSAGRAQAGAAGAQPWAKGGVQRASRCVVGVGGKGQNAAAACAALPVPVLATVVQPVAGHEGRALVDAQRAASGDRVRLMSWKMHDPAARTRVCCTLVDGSGACAEAEAVTEVVEPSAPFSEQDAVGLASLIRQALGRHGPVACREGEDGQVGEGEEEVAQSASGPHGGRGSAHGGDGVGADDDDDDDDDAAAAAEEEEEAVPPVSGLALMGSVPAGFDGAFALAVELAQRLRNPGGRTLGGLTDGSPPVLLDGFRGEAVLRALRAGGIHVLKVNAEELRELAAAALTDAAAAAGAAEGAASAIDLPSRGAHRFEALERAAVAVHRAFGLRLVAVTDGPRSAHLFDFRPSVAVTISLQAAGTQPAFEARVGASPRRLADLGTPSASPRSRAPAAAAAGMAARYHLAVAGASRAAASAPEDAALFGARGGLLFAAHSFRLPPLPRQPGPGGLVSPIGAGDTCSGVFLACLARGIVPADAFAHGLAAATASCQHLENARFSTSDVAERWMPAVAVDTWREVAVDEPTLAA
ncbi:hypothetical protein FNF31_02277 [Cafeteria roenbergensis]|uniref:Carbohydrate kinase PfkB domain-containing protein n=1 Tax=Cafeteria roenbergensis TaxID=33653 RepID=A0A5A8DL92_CAFRO|nr:hypothetical protein FNF31_02277 [Cafeteria roenbergensis]